MAPIANTPGGPAINPALLPPAELLRLGGLELIARLAVEGYLAGRHRSPGRGGALEFAEHRPYVQGDDLRRVDWKVYGRTDRHYVRESEAETNVRATLVVDGSASMDFSTGGGPTKWEYGRAVAAALVHLLIGQQDAVGVALFTDRLVAYVAPRGGRAQRAHLMELLEGAKPGGRTAPEIPFRELAERLPRRGVLILLSDLLAPPDRFLPGLRYFRHRKHELIVFHVLDPGERSLEGLDPAAAVVDAESRRVLTSNPRELVREYAGELTKLESTYRAQAHDRGFDFIGLTTDEPLAAALGGYLLRRRV